MKKNTLAVIVGRGGSKGLPGKNVAKLGGRPVVAWSVDAALGSKQIDRVIISSDDQEIIDAATTAGCDAPFQRPPELATNDASVYDVIIHALENVGDTYDLVVLLQATSPLRTSDDIDTCIRACCEAGAPAGVSMTEATKPPHWMYSMDDDRKITPLVDGAASVLRRQDVQTYYVPNGAIYVADVEWFLQNKTFYSSETVGYTMPKERSVDIDTSIDLMLARAIVNERTDV
jgi:CMP-N,N'-diacetyllegionaminic acid synthase